MSNIMKMLISGAAIVATVIVGYKVIKSTMKRNLPFRKQISEKIQQEIWRDNDIAYPTLRNPHWKKIGKVNGLFISPVKSSKMLLACDSLDFRDYGMGTRKYKTYLWDGMFIIYNKTKDKFEDSRTYSLLETMIAVSGPNDTGEVMITDKKRTSAVTFNTKQYRNSSNRFIKETWNGTKAFYGSNRDINTWLKDKIKANDINGADEDIYLTQTIPHDWDSTREIKDNWFRFVEGYKSVEKDETGKFITLPHFVLITKRTGIRTGIQMHKNIDKSPNIIVDIDEWINVFEEQSWDWIKIGNDVILRNVKPSHEGEFPHFRINCGLWSGGNVKVNDEVFIYSPDI
nr:PREDICTED: uncharacterized protein LOC105679175 isoform X1 [Linepithema humile]